MSTYFLFGKEVSFSDAADRYFDLKKSFGSAVENASTLFKIFYEKAGSISNVLDDYMTTVANITQECAIDPLYATLVKAKIYDISRERFEDECWDLEAAEPCYNCIADRYNEIEGNLAKAKHNRAVRKASRSRYGWMSSTDGGAIVNAAITAGTLNAMSGVGHSVVNGIGNIGSSIAAAASKSSLYKNTKTKELLDEGVRDCITNIYNNYIYFINDYKEQEGEGIWVDGSPYEPEKANTLLENALKIPEKEKELLFKAFSVCPYHYDLSATIFLKYEEERKNIFNIAKKYKNDLTPIVEAVIESMYTEEAQDSESEAQKVKKKILSYMREYGISENETLDQLEYDCLVRLCEPYEDSIPGENQALLDSFINYDASDDIKAEVIADLMIWELASKYGVEFDDEEKEEIISSFIEQAKDEKKLGSQVIYEKARFIMKQLNVTESESLFDFEYDVLKKITAKYHKLPVGEAECIIKQFRNSFVSAKAKRKFVSDSDMWELVKYYHIVFPDEKKDTIIYNAFKHMTYVEHVADQEVIKKLTTILKELDVMDKGGNIPQNRRETLFKLLTGLKEAENQYEKSMRDSWAELTLPLRTELETNISESSIVGFNFLATPLTYRKEEVGLKAQKLKYCTLLNNEQPFIIYDAHSIRSEHEYGFCLTDQRLLANQDRSKFEVKIEEIISFQRKGPLSSKILVNTQNGIKELEVSNLSDLQRLSEYFNKILIILPDLKKEQEKKVETYYKQYRKQSLTCIERHEILVDFFSAENIVSDIRNEKPKSASCVEVSTDLVKEMGHSTKDQTFTSSLSVEKEDATTPISTYTEPKHQNIGILQEQTVKQMENNEVNRNQWFSILLLVVCYPLVLMLLMLLVLEWLPEGLFFAIFALLQITALVYMCKKCNWNIWIKVLVIAAYVWPYLA